MWAWKKENYDIWNHTRLRHREHIAHQLHVLFQIRLANLYKSNVSVKSVGITLSEAQSIDTVCMLKTCTNRSCWRACLHIHTQKTRTYTHHTHIHTPHIHNYQQPVHASKTKKQTIHTYLRGWVWCIVIGLLPWAHHGTSTQLHVVFTANAMLHACMGEGVYPLPSAHNWTSTHCCLYLKMLCACT